MSNFSFSPTPIHLKGKSKMPIYLKRILQSILCILAIIVAWLFWRQYSPAPYDKLQNIMNAGKWEKAAHLNYNLITNSEPPDLRLLLNGVVINFALRDLNIINKDIPYYEYEKILRQMDPEKIFLTESYFQKLYRFPESRYFLTELCMAYKEIPNLFLRKNSHLLLQRTRSFSNMRKPQHQCMHEIFDDENLGEFTKVVDADNLILRTEPSRESSIKKKLSRGTRVFIIKTGNEETIGNITNIWIKVMDKDQTFGWLFGAYLK